MISNQSSDTFVNPKMTLCQTWYTCICKTFSKLNFTKSSKKKVPESNMLTHEAACIRKKKQEEETLKKAELQKAHLELERLHFDEEHKHNNDRNPFEINISKNIIQEDLIICDICNKFLDINHLDTHPCLCVICLVSYPSELLDEHKKVCPSLRNNNKNVRFLINDNNENEERFHINPINHTNNTTIHPHLNLFNNTHAISNSNSNRNNNRPILSINPVINTPPIEEDFPSLNVFQSHSRLPPKKKKIIQKLTKEKINILPIMTFKMEFNHGNLEEEKCMICMEEFLETEKLRILTCLHRYHVACIDQWLGEHGLCPICKEPLDL